MRIPRIQVCDGDRGYTRQPTACLARIDDQTIAMGGDLGLVGMAADENIRLFLPDVKGGAVMSHYDARIADLDAQDPFLDPACGGALKPLAFAVIVPENTPPVTGQFIDIWYRERRYKIPGMKDKLNFLLIEKIDRSLDRRKVVVGIGQDAYAHYRFFSNSSICCTMASST